MGSWRKMGLNNLLRSSYQPYFFFGLVIFNIFVCSMVYQAGKRSVICDLRRIPYQNLLRNQNKYIRQNSRFQINGPKDIMNAMKKAQNADIKPPSGKIDPDYNENDLQETVEKGKEVLKHMNQHGKKVAHESKHFAQGAARNALEKLKHHQSLQKIPGNAEFVNALPPKGDCPSLYMCSGFPLPSKTPNICQGIHQLSVIFLIETRMSEGMIRSAMRNSWAKHTRDSNTKMRHIFVMGTNRDESAGYHELETEMATYSDMLVFPFSDSRRLQSLRIISALHYIHTTCKHYDVVLRVDGSMYVNLPKLEIYLEDASVLEGLQHSWFGNCPLGPRTVIRDVDHQWYVSKETWPQDTYPRYCDGSFGYGLGRVLIHSILQVAPHTRYLPFEDSFFGVTVDKLGLNKDFYLDIPNFAVRYDDGNVETELKEEGCSHMAKYFIWRYVPWNQMQILYSSCPMKQREAYLRPNV